MTVFRSKTAIVALFGAALLAAPADAQQPGGGGQQQRAPENLQVLPKDLRRDSVTTIMRTFTVALGVQCVFCHTEREGGGGGGGGGTPPAGGPPGGGGGGGAGGGGGGGGGPPLNYALDNKDQKKTARLMLKMVDSINKVFLTSLPTRDMAYPIAVNCMTCHRGVARPMTIDAVLATTIDKSGVDSAIARYRVLRADLASGRYNFTEQPVTLAAQRLAATGKHDEALKLLQMNLEYNPTSANIDNEIAEVLITKGDRDAGIARLRAILARNPNDRRALARLTQLGVTP